MKEYKVGEVAYVSEFGRRQVEIDCPVCFRKGYVKLILGNDDIVQMPCEYCNNGLGTHAKGFVTEYRLDAGVKRITVSEVISNETSKGKEIEYRDGYHIYYPKDIFDTEEQAFAESKRRSVEYNLEHETKAEFIKGKPDKNYSWNAGYHIREAKKAQIDVEHHNKMAVICKAKTNELT